MSQAGLGNEVDRARREHGLTPRVRPASYTHRLSIGIARLENLYVCLYTELYLILQKFPSIVEGKLKIQAFRTWHSLKIQEISSHIFGRKSHFPECNAAVDFPCRGEKKLGS